MVHLVFRLQATEDGYRRLYRWFLNLNWLKPSFKSSVLSDRLPILIGYPKCLGIERAKRSVNLRVVAPTSCKPRASAGLIICPASMLPSAFPRLNNVSNDVS